MKPPLGLRPRFIADEHRLREVREAIIRYREAGYAVPYEWWEELADLVERAQPTQVAPHPAPRYRYSPVTIAECGGPCEQGPEHCDCGEIKPEPTPPPAPAVGLVQELAFLIAGFASTSRIGDDATPTAREVLRKMAAWCRDRGDYGVAGRLQGEADR